MGYCSYADVVALTGTTVAEGDVSSLIDVADAQIEGILAGQGLTAPSFPTPAEVFLASLYLSSALVLERSHAEGSLPETLRAGDMSVRLEVREQAREWRAKALEMLGVYIGRTSPSSTLVRVEPEEV
ncbi:MAG: hypothetical protein ACXQS2_05340 [Methermicoccaceae archaeon]